MRKSNLSIIPVLIACNSLGGCAAWGAGFGFGTSTAPSTPIPQGSSHYVNFSISSENRVVTGVVTGILFAEGVRHYSRQDDGALAPFDRVPELDPNRRINEQDCSAVVLLDGGNLRCR